MARGYLLRPKNDGQWSHWRAVFGWGCLLVAGFFFLAPLPANGQTPAKPTGLMAQAGDGEVTLTWDDPGDSSITIWQYRYRVGNASYGDWTDVLGSSAMTTTVTVMGLTNGSSHRFVVRAVNDDGEGPQSVVVSARPQAQVPAKPTGLMAEAGDGQVTLTWDDLNDQTVSGWQYKVKSGGSFDDVSWLDIPNSGEATTSHVVMSLTNGVSYRFKVRAKNSSGPGIESNQSNAATPQAQVPAKPTGLMAQAGDGEVTLTWDDLNDQTVSGWQYKVKSGGSFDDVSWLDISNSGAATTSHVVMSLTNGVSYRFKVRAVNSSGPGTESNESNAATPQAQVPAKPTGLMAEAGDGQVTLTWDDPGDSSITKWQYRYRVGNAGYGDAWTDVSDSGPTTTTVKVTGLTNDSSHRFQVRAVNANGPGPETAEVSARPMGVPNAPPTAEAGVGTSVAEGASVTLDGSDSSDPEGLDLTFQWSQTGGTPTVVLSGADTATATFAAPTELLVDVDLEFTLSVSDGVNDAVTDMVTITVLAGPNDPPTADAGAGEDTTFEEGATVTLDGSGSFDPEDVDLTYLWRQTGGTPTTGQVRIFL